MKTNVPHILALTLFVGVAAAVAGCTSITTSPDGNVQIQRTKYGVAHITASNYESIAYGIAYAHAQDNVCQTANQLVTIRGERSKFFGPGARGLLGLRQMANEQIDFFIRFHMDDAALLTANRTASANAQAASKGYVAGFNRFLSDTGANDLPLPCRGAAWVRPMSEGDFYRLQELTMIQVGVGFFADALLAAQPPATTVASAGISNPVQQSSVEGSILAEQGGTDAYPYPDDVMLGSNGWAFGKESTPNGRGLLLGNPHFPWQGDNRFWQMHLVIPGELDVMGASIGHVGFVLIGFNRDVAWTHTVSTGKRFTLHELTLDPTDPTAYLFDGASRKMVSETIEIETLNADGKLATKRQTMWRSVWGPILVMPRRGLTWNAATAYAIKDANASNVRSADTWIAMNKARSVDELRAALGNSAIPWVNTIAADRHGQAMYADLSVVPDIGDEQLQRCAPSKTAAALFASADIAVLDGSRSSCDWHRDPVAPVPGLIPPNRMPVLIRNDWVQNSNDSYWLSNPGVTIPNISPMVGQIKIPQRLRTRIGIEEIRARLSGKDGLSGNKMGPGEAQAVLFRNRNKAAQLVVSDLMSACATATDSEIREGCAALQGWDYNNNIDSRGAPLFKEFWRAASEIPNVWRVPFNAADPINTPAGLNLGDSAVRDIVLDAFVKAVRALKKAGFRADAALGSVQFRNTNLGRIAVHGGAEFEGVLNKVGMFGPAAVTENGFIVDFGTSYVQTVTFDDRGPLAQGLLTYGQSSDPASSYAYDQLPSYSRKQWIDLPFHPRDVEAQAVGPVLRLHR